MGLNWLKELIVWSWTYLWAAWFVLVGFVLFYLRGPLKIGENLGMATMFLSTLTPKFYVALTGTSSLISGLILIFEWWYYRRYGMSFIEQVSLNHISPWLGGGEAPEQGATSPPSVPECKVWRNPLNLFRGADAGKPEYEIMQTAWRERNPGARIKAAKEAIGLNPECATAYILLAEEEQALDIAEAETQVP